MYLTMTDRPKDLMDVVRCGCKAAVKTCSTERCNCHHNKISWTVHCSYVCSDTCFNPFKAEQKEENETEAGIIESDVEGDEGGENSDIDSDDEWEWGIHEILRIKLSLILLYSWLCSKFTWFLMVIIYYYYFIHDALRTKLVLLLLDSWLCSKATDFYFLFNLWSVKYN